MPRADETIFVLHGLEEDNRVVRARVFAQKLRILLAALQDADRIANGKLTFDYLLPRLETGSAAVTIRERQRRRSRSTHSAISVLETTANAIYNGDRNLDRMPPSLVKRLQRLSEGAARKFSHGELAFPDDNVIRIDDYLLRQSEAAYEFAREPESHLRDRYYRGLAIGSFDGFLKEIDARGTMLRGKLLLTAGGFQIDCIMNKDRVPEARESFDKRVVIEGTAHYDGKDQIPVRVDVRSIRIIKEQADLLRWKGALRPVADEAEDDW
jgi:hypothetical protein